MLAPRGRHGNGGVSATVGWKKNGNGHLWSALLANPATALHDFLYTEHNKLERLISCHRARYERIVETCPWAKIQKDDEGATLNDRTVGCIVISCPEKHFRVSDGGVLYYVKLTTGIFGRSNTWETIRHSQLAISSIFTVSTRGTEEWLQVFSGIVLGESQLVRYYPKGLSPIYIWVWVFVCVSDLTPPHVGGALLIHFAASHIPLKDNDVVLGRTQVFRALAACNRS